MGFWSNIFGSSEKSQKEKITNDLKMTNLKFDDVIAPLEMSIIQGQFVEAERVLDEVCQPSRKFIESTNKEIASLNLSPHEAQKLIGQAFTLASNFYTRVGNGYFERMTSINRLDKSLVQAQERCYQKAVDIANSPECIRTGHGKPELVLAYFGLARSVGLQGRDYEGEEYLRKCIQISTNDSTALACQKQARRMLAS